METSINDHHRRVCLNCVVLLFPCSILCGVLGELCTDISIQRLGSWSDIFRVVLMEHFFRNESRVLDLSRIARLKESELERK
jgi:hypothetical protein